MSGILTESSPSLILNMDILITGEEYQNQDVDEVFEDNTGGAEGLGSLSLEVVGRDSFPKSSNREFELENKFSELSEFLLSSVREEKKELERNLVVKGETLKENGQVVRDPEEKCIDLQLQLDFLEEDMKTKAEKLEDNVVNNPHSPNQSGRKGDRRCFSQFCFKTY